MATERLPAKPPLVYFHGYGRDAGRRIATGVPEWDDNLFVSHDESVARLYGGKHVDRIIMKPGTRVKRVDNFAHKAKRGEDLIQTGVRILRDARRQGYHVVEFYGPHDVVGHVILDPSQIANRELHWTDPRKSGSPVEQLPVAHRAPGRISRGDDYDVSEVFNASGIHRSDYEDPYEIFTTPEGRVVAASSFGWRDVGDGEREASFSVAVLPRYRRQGIARRLVQSIINKHPGATLRPWVVNPNMAALLEDMGFSSESSRGWSQDTPYMDLTVPTREEARRAKERAAAPKPVWTAPPPPPPGDWRHDFKGPVNLAHLELSTSDLAEGMRLRAWYAAHPDARQAKVEELLSQRYPISGMTGLTAYARPHSGDFWQLVLKVDSQGKDESRGERVARLTRNPAKNAVEGLSTPRRSQAEPRWLPLADVERWVPTMARQGVSKVARSPRGFLPAYRRAGGDPSRLSDAWRRKRAGFVARHMAQVEARGEHLVDGQGQPSRRHLALIAWAYNPQPRATRSPVEHLPVTTVRDPVEYQAAETWRRECGDAWLYHVTSADRIPSIQEGGVQSRQGSRPSNFGGDGFDEHTRNRVFFSADLKTAQAWASYLPISDPIILRVKPDELDGKLLTDGRAQGLFPCSFYAEGVTVPPQDISIWDRARSRWVSLSRWTDRHRKIPFWQVGARTRRRAVKKHPPSWPTGHSPNPISRLSARQSYPQWAGPPEVPGTGPNLREVAPGLWVGSEFAAAEPPTPEGRWGLIIDMREGDPDTGRWARKYLRLRVVDGQPIPHAHLDQALHAYQQSVGPTLVHCHWGLSRSPSVAAALLIVEHGLSEAEATRRVSPYREDADPDEETWYDDVDGAVEWPRRATINSVLRWARTYRPTPS